ncbi:hypothetical protein TTRE_0000430001 [Trichuris trichiura]|uniref:Uncharacterized protein n=1 Tax=Trichuris trichiura TaxID=36087 RepID=A0A077Z738_TRITR|nr:hypothetical protein TTRE_0000430001 [Trichuris trichiura]
MAAIADSQLSGAPVQSAIRRRAFHCALHNVATERTANNYCLQQDKSHRSRQPWQSCMMMMMMMAVAGDSSMSLTLSDSRPPRRGRVACCQETTPPSRSSNSISTNHRGCPSKFQMRACFYFVMYALTLTTPWTLLLLRLSHFSVVLFGPCWSTMIRRWK